MIYIDSVCSCPHRTLNPNFFDELVKHEWSFGSQPKIKSLAKLSNRNINLNNKTVFFPHLCLAWAIEFTYCLLLSSYAFRQSAKNERCVKARKNFMSKNRKDLFVTVIPVDRKCCEHVRRSHFTNHFSTIIDFSRSFIKSSASVNTGTWLDSWNL